MEYPGAKFIYPLRKTMLIFFIMVFFIMAPIIILYTEGYRWDWKNGFLKETGAISVDVLPKNSTVYLNGIKLKDKMPIRLNNAAPAKYSIRIIAPGFFDWTKNIEVKNKQTEYIKEVSLIKKNKPKLLISGGITELALSNDSNFLAYGIKQKNTTEFWIYNILNGASTRLFSSENSQPQIIWAKKNNFEIIFEKDKNLAMIINAEKPAEQISLYNLESKQINKIEWSESSDPQLFYSTADEFVSFFPATGQRTQISKNNYVDWHMNSGQLWTLFLNTSTNKYEIKKDILGFSSILAKFDSDGSSWKLLTARKNAALLKKIGAEEMLVVDDKKIYPFAGDKFLISDYNDWWLMWTKWELWTYSYGEEPYLLNRSGENLKDLEPMDEFNTLALIWEKKMTVLFPYYLVAHELLDENINMVEANSKDKILYFTAEIKGQNGIWSLNY